MPRLLRYSRIAVEGWRLPMGHAKATQEIPVRTSSEVVGEIDALAAATEQSRDFIVDQALRQYLEAATWQIEKIKKGLTAAREGRVRPAEDVFAEIAAKHGWER